MANRHFSIMSRARRMLAGQEAEVAARLLSQYAVLASDLAGVVDDLGARMAAGELSRAGLIRLEQTQLLLRQLEDGLQTITESAIADVSRLKSAGVRVGQDSVLATLLDEGIRADQLIRLNPDAAAQMVLRSANNQRALGQVIRELAPAARQAAEDALIRSLILGESPVDVARRLNRLVGGTLPQNMLTVARTEMMAASREAGLASMQNHSHLLRGWVWIAAVGRDPAPCPMCIALHGQYFLWRRDS